MADDYRVPVQKLPVVLYGKHAERVEVMLYLPQGLGIEAFFESPEVFFAASESNNFRLYNRRAITCIEVPRSSVERPDYEDGLPSKESKVRVRMIGGMEHRGLMKYVAYEGITRPVDVLNQSPQFFAVYEALVIRYVAKAHVEYVQEERE
jgi:hypothetical protein